MLYICLVRKEVLAELSSIQQERFLKETQTAVFLYVLQDGEVYAMNSFPHLHRLGFLLNADGIQSFHIHEFSEVILVAKGHLLHEVNGNHHLLQAGSLVFVRPYDFHRILPVNSERTVFASLVLASSVIREIMSYLCTPAILHHFKAAAEAPCFQLSPDDTRTLMLQMERISNAQAVAPETSLSLTRALAAQLFAENFALPKSDAPSGPLPPGWLARLREEAEDWVSLKDAPHRLHHRGACHPSHLCKSFKRFYNETPTAFINRLRLRRAAKFLAEPTSKIASVALELGFDSLSHFHRLFKRHYGLTPAQYRRSQSTASQR